jgi:hypothetical protein
MEAHTVNHHNTPPTGKTMSRPFDDAFDSAFDSALKQHFQSEPEPGDDGFSQHVMAALPSHALPRRVAWTQWALHGQWVAISLAGCGVAALMSLSQERADFAQSLAAYVFIGLLVFWSIPSRWSRG